MILNGTTLFFKKMPTIWVHYASNQCLGSLEKISSIDTDNDFSWVLISKFKTIIANRRWHNTINTSCILEEECYRLKNICLFLEIPFPPSWKYSEILEFTYHFVHFKLGIWFGAEQFIWSCRDELLHHVGEKQEVIEEKTIEFFVALCLIKLATVQKFPWSQTVGQWVENQLLGEKENYAKHTDFLHHINYST